MQSAEIWWCKNTPFCICKASRLEFSLSPLSPDTTSKLDVLRHNGDSLGVDRTEIGIFEEPHEVGFRGFLKSKHSRALEAEIRLEVLCDLTHEALEWKLSD